jgi:hypothetical protein
VQAYWYAGEEIRGQGLAMGAEGIIGVQLDPRAWRSESRPVFKMILTVVGTAIVAAPYDETRGPDRHPLSPGARLLGGTFNPFHP